MIAQVLKRGLDAEVDALLHLIDPAPGAAQHLVDRRPHGGLAHDLGDSAAGRVTDLPDGLEAPRGHVRDRAPTRTDEIAQQGERQHPGPPALVLQNDLGESHSG